VTPSSRPGRPAGALRRALTTTAAVLLLVPVVEIVVAVTVARWIGVDATLLLVVLGSVAGLWVLRRAGVGAVRELGRLRTGARAGREVGDAGLRFAAGALLLFPGLLTDLAGLLLLLPPVRSAVAGMLGRRLRRRFEVGMRRMTVHGEVVDGVTVTSWVEDDPGSRPPGLPASGLPRSGGEADDDGAAPGRGPQRGRP
jgi:UPF0716 protein FxsA